MSTYLRIFQISSVLVFSLIPLWPSDFKFLSRESFYIYKSRLALVYKIKMIKKQMPFPHYHHILKRLPFANQLFLIILAYLVTTNYTGPGEMVQQLEALAILAEDLGLAPTEWSTTIHNSSSRDSASSSDLLKWKAHRWHTYIMQAKRSYI